MPRYIAFLRGVSPTNARMLDLKHSFEDAGFTEVKTIRSSGNIVFKAHTNSETMLAYQVEIALENRLGRTFYTIVRPLSYLHHLVVVDPYAAFDLPANARRIVTFIGESHPANLALPMDAGDGLILTRYGRDVLSAYIPGLSSSKVMMLIEKTFGTQLTTRTWETVRKCAAA